MRPGKLTKAASTVHYAATTPAMAAAQVRKAKKPRIGLYVGLGVGVAVAVAAVIFAPKLLDKYNQHKEVVAAEQAATNTPPPPPPEPEAGEILQKLDATYKAFTSYSVQGISVGTVDMSQVNPKLTQPQIVTTKLSLRLGRPDHYRMEWERGQGPQHIKGAIWAAGKGDFIHTGNTTARVKDRETALTTAASSSGTLGMLTAAMFFGETNSPATVLKNFMKSPSETLNNQKCYVLTGQLGHMNLMFWIRKSDFVIAQTELILGGKVDEAELAGKSYAQKAQLERAAKLKGNFIETYQEIVLNKALNPADFETSFPPNAAPAKPEKQQRRSRH
jgi:hypothetical protein